MHYIFLNFIFSYNDEVYIFCSQLMYSSSYRSNYCALRMPDKTNYPRAYSQMFNRSDVWAPRGPFRA